MHLRTKLAALVMAGGAAVMLASAPPAASASAVTETASGAIYGKAAAANNSVIPLTWRGLVNTHGPWAPGGVPKKGSLIAFTTSAGKVTIEITAKPAIIQNFNPKACHFAATIHVVLAIVGGKSTGKFAGASGAGAATFYAAGYAPKYTSGPHKGQCNNSPNAPTLPNGAVETFQLSAGLKV
jgi:hypothetical protein